MNDEPITKLYENKITYYRKRRSLTFFNNKYSVNIN